MTPMNDNARRPWNERGSQRRTKRGGRMRRHMRRNWSLRPAPASALGECVADTSNRQDKRGGRGIVLDLVAKVADMDVDRLLVLVESLVVAQELEQLAAGIDAAGP